MQDLFSTGVRIWPGAYRARRRGGSPSFDRRVRFGAGTRGRCGGLLGHARGTGHQIGGFTHEGSFPGAGPGRRFGRCHPLSGSGRSAVPLFVLSAIPNAASYLAGSRRARPPRTVRPPQPASLVAQPVCRQQRCCRQLRREHDSLAMPAAANPGANPDSVARAGQLRPLRMAGRRGNCRTPWSTVHRPRLAGVAVTGWVNVRGSRSPPLVADRTGGKQVGTLPQRGASGAAPSLTPCKPTAFLRSRPSVP